MTKVAVLILAGTGSGAGIGRVVNGLQAAKEFTEADDDVRVIFDGAATAWVPALADEDHDYHALFAAVEHRVGVCDYCAGAFDVSEAVDATGVDRLDEYEGHPSLRDLVVDGYEVITF
jgi:hypothetical protein